MARASNEAVNGRNGRQPNNLVFLNKSVIESLISGSLSSTLTTVLYQPLELLKTNIQLRTQDKSDPSFSSKQQIFGRATGSAITLARDRGIGYLWRGTVASLLRSGPGVGLYYALLSVLQTNFSQQDNRPDTASQAFIFGLAARSMVSFILLPVTVVKVRYESGNYIYPSLAHALKRAYLGNGWVGATPTILRDSLFSGTYYMCYTELKSGFYIQNSESADKSVSHGRNFVLGIVSGLVASILTNPIDVLKTHVQSSQEKQSVSMKQVVHELMKSKHGYMRFFDGIVPRSLRRTLIAATTWTSYELIVGAFNS